jgi:hypothetical protein
VSKETIAQRTRMKIRFQDQDTDYYFMQALVYAGEKGSELGECFTVAEKIKEKDPESLIRAWTTFSDRLEAQADKALDAGHIISAREAYLRAFTYHRMQLYGMRSTDQRLKPCFSKARKCFRKAAELMPVTIEAISVPYKDMMLPGYFIRGGQGDRKLPTVIFTIGGEIFAEEAYFWCGAAGARRGYNMVLVDCPFHIDSI